MFGALILGTLALGQASTAKFTPLKSDSTIVSFTTAGPLTPAAVPLAATAGLRIESAATVTAIGPLVADAPTVTIATAAGLAIGGTLQASAALTVSVAPPAIVVAGPLSAAATLTVSTAPLTLTVGALTLSGAPAWTVSALAAISTLPATFTAAPAIAFAVTANVAIVGPGATSVIVTWNGVDHTRDLRQGSIAIEDAINEAPNRCDFIANQNPPALGTDIKIGLQNTLTENLLFAGVVVSVSQRHELQRINPAWDISCSDYAFLLNRRKVFGVWKDTSATTIALSLLATYSAGFSSAGIAAGLPAITVSFNGEDFMDALTQIATAVGGYTYVDYAKVVHLYITESTGAPPDALDGAHESLMNDAPITYATDLSQVRTRVYVKGASASVINTGGFAIPVGAALIPMEDASIFSAGQVIDGEGHVLNYTGTHAGNVSTVLTGNVPAPAGAPLVAIAAQAGGLDGRYWWKVAFSSGDGETAPGPSSAFADMPPVAAPSSAPGLGASGSEVGPLIGTYGYRVSFVTALGETLPGPAVSRTAQPVTVGAPVMSIVDAPAAGVLTCGQTYKYWTTFATKYGETNPIAQGTYFCNPLTLPGWNTAVPVNFGGLKGGAYYYGVTMVTALGESAPLVWALANNNMFTGAPFGSPTWTGGQDANGRIAPGKTYVWAASLFHDTYGETPLGTSFTQAVNPASVPIRMLINLSFPNGLGRAHGIRVYRAYQGYGFQLNAEFRGSIPGSYWDPLAQEECGQFYPVQPSAGAAMSLNILFANEFSVIARRIYRTKAGGTDFFLVGEIQHNNTTSFLDDTPDASLTVRAPVAQTTGRQARVSVGFPSPGRVGILGRRIYRTKAGGSTYYLVADIQDMQTASFDDNMADGALATATMPATNTAGGDVHVLTFIPTGPSGTLARRIYRTAANGTQYRFLAELSDNVTNSFIDRVPDNELGAAPPLRTTAGASAARLFAMPLGPVGVKQRIIYRTKANDPLNFFYVGTLNDNTSTEYIDDKADSALGRAPLERSSIGALPGDTSLNVQSTVGFPLAGWLRAESQVIQWNGISGNLLTGIPPLLAVTGISRSGPTATAGTVAPHGYVDGQRIVILGTDQPEYSGTHEVKVTGSNTFTYVVNGSPASPATSATAMRCSAAGAITAAIPGDTSVVSAPALMGVSGVSAPIRGGSLALWVTCNSPTGQSTLAALEGGDGIHEYIVSDGALDSVARCTARGNAELALFQFAKITVTYRTLDLNSRSGKTIHVALPPPQNFTGDFLITTVRISAIDTLVRTNPTFTVTASNTRYSLADLLKHVVLDR